MKNLKKLISVIIAVIMLVGSFATVSAADYADVESTNSYYKAIKVLSGLGIVNGDDEGNFNPKSDIKRSEMVALVCRAMGEEDIATGSVTNLFTDVAANHWAAGYIAWGVNRGIINGMGDGTFAPDASVSYQDAVVMILRSLGFDRIAKRAENGGYPVGYLKLASQYGVLKDAGYDNTAAATREIVAQLIYNGITAPMVDVTEYGDSIEDDKYVIYHGIGGRDLKTLLTDINGIAKVKAKITSTPRQESALIDKDGAYQVSLSVVANGYYGDSASDLADALEIDTAYFADFDVYVGATDAIDLFQSTVEAYIAQDAETNGLVLLAVVADAKSVVEETVVAADVDFVSFTAGTPNEFKYIDAADKEQIIDVDSTYDVYFNGQKISGSGFATKLGYIASTTGETVADLEDLLLNVADEVTFMGPKTGDYNAIFVTDYQYVKVTEVMAEELFISAENVSGLSTAIDLDFENRNDAFVYNIYDAEGNAMDIADIEENDILNIVAPVKSAYDYTATDIDYLDIYVTDASVTGRVDGHVAGAKYIVDGEVYTILPSVSLGDQGTFYLTIDGKVFACEAESTLSKDFAFIIAHQAETVFGTKTHILRVFKADGTIENLTVASTVTLTAPNPANSYTYEKFTAKRGTEQDTVATYLEGFFAENVSADWVKNAIEARIMTYSLNANGEIKEMRFASTNTAEDFVVATASSANWNKDIVEFAGNEVADSSVLFVAPVTLNAATSKYTIDEDNLEIATFESMDEDKAGGYYAKVFNFDNDDYLGAAVVTEEITSAIKGTHLAVVQSKSSTLDAEDVTVDKYTFVQGGEVLSLAVDADYSAPTMAAGDIFRYTVNAEGNIDSIQLIYDASAETFSTTYTFGSLASNDMAIVYGGIKEIKSGKMTLSATNIAGSAITGADVPTTALRIADGEGFTYASIDEARVQGTVNTASGVKALAGAANLKASYGTKDFYVVAIVNENNRFEDCVMIIK